MKTNHICNAIVAAHLSTKRDINRSQTTSRAYSLKEELEGNIIDFLDVENSERYQPTKTQTFCNIYAHDFAMYMNVYIPRVWWTERALKEKNTEKAVYNDNVIEMSVNSLYKWFDEYGKDFGWREIADFKEGQEAANNGSCVVLLASNKVASRSGHITVVVPETAEFKAKTVNSVYIPVQSQAGRSNFKRGVVNWWEKNHNKVKMYLNDLPLND